MPSITTCDRYLDLLKESLLKELYVENELRISYLRHCLETREQVDYSWFLCTANARPDILPNKIGEIGFNYGSALANLELQRSTTGRRRLENIEFCMREILDRDVPGDCIECGVSRGGATILMRGFLAARGITDRMVWVADPSEGLYGSSADFPSRSIDLAGARDLFRRYCLLDDQVKFVPGWFKDTLPAAPIRQLSLFLLDGDLYEPTMDALNALYGRVSPGGFVVIDDYGVLPPCQKAVDDFRDNRGITSPLQKPDGSGVYWQKDRPDRPHRAFSRL